MAGKKVHWMKTPKGRRHLKKMQKARAAKQAEKQEKGYAIHIHSANVTPLRESPDAESKIHIPSYLQGRIEAIIHDVASRTGITFESLAEGVIRILQDGQSR